MNQHFDGGIDENDDGLEQKLSAINLAAPSENFQQIPQTLQTADTTPIWDQWRWLAAGSAVCVVAIYIWLQADSGSPDTPVATVQAPENVSPESVPVLDEQTSLAANLPEPPFLEGTHFVEIANPIEMSDINAVEVVSFFWYACGGCYSFEPMLTDWANQLSDDVNFTRVPAIWSPAMRLHARVYFTAGELGILDYAHDLLFAEFQKDTVSVTNEVELMEIFEQLGISPDEFTFAYNSPTALDRLQQAEQQNFDYQIQSTPSMFIGGRYGISPAGAGGYSQMLEVADYLIDSLQNCDEPTNRLC